MDWNVILSAGVGGVAVKAVGDIIVAAIRKKRSPHLSPEEITVQFSALMQASESYREEVRLDMDRMKRDFSDLQTKYETEMTKMKDEYELQIKTMQTQIAAMKTEITEYRRENGALHLLLRDQGIEVPSWVKKPTEK